MMSQTEPLFTETPEQNPVPESSPAPQTIPERSMALGDTLVRMGKLRKDDIARVLKHSTRTGKKFGTSAIELGLVKAKDINAALSIQQGMFHNDGKNVRVPPALVTLHSPHTEEAEQFRRIRTRLLTKTEGAALKLLCVSGAGNESACSFVAANLAVAVSQLGRRVLLIDSNLRLSHLSQIMGYKPRQGLTDVMRGSIGVKDAFAPSQIRNLTFLPAGRPSYNPQEVLCSEAYARLVMEQISNFDSVIINTGDSVETADAQLIWSLTKSVLLVARRDRTRMPSIKKLTELVVESHAQLVGTVMTK